MTMLALIGVLFVSMFLSVGYYAWYSLSVRKYLKYAGYEKLWHAWLPILREYSISMTMKDDDGCVSVCGMVVDAQIFGVWALISLVLGFIPNAGYILSLVLSAVCRYTMYRYIYRVCDAEDKTFVLSILSAVGLPVFVIFMTAFKPQISSNLKVQREDDSVFDI